MIEITHHKRNHESVEDGRLTVSKDIVVVELMSLLPSSVVPDLCRYEGRLLLPDNGMELSVIPQLIHAVEKLADSQLLIFDWRRVSPNPRFLFAVLESLFFPATSDGSLTQRPVFGKRVVVANPDEATLLFMSLCLLNARGHCAVIPDTNTAPCDLLYVGHIEPRLEDFLNYLSAKKELTVQQLVQKYRRVESDKGKAGLSLGEIGAAEDVKDDDKLSRSIAGGFKDLWDFGLVERQKVKVDGPKKSRDSYQYKLFHPCSYLNPNSTPPPVRFYNAPRPPRLKEKPRRWLERPEDEPEPPPATRLTELNGRFIGAEEYITGPSVLWAFPDRMALSGDAWRTNYFPFHSGNVIGRSEEIKAVSQLLSEGTVVTLSGPEGCGKTRLAAAVAANVQVQYGAGIDWVDLRGLSADDADYVLMALRDDITAQSTSPPERRLIILDNCESTLTEVREALSALIQQGRHIDFLLTSRYGLKFKGEREYPVPPMVYTDSLALVADILGPADSQFMAAFNKLSDEISGNPLAIELIAGAYPSAPGEAVDLVQQLKPSSVSGGIVEVTAGLLQGLNEQERQLLYALATFPTGCGQGAAARVALLDADKAQRALASLLKKRILYGESGREELRYRLHDSVRIAILNDLKYQQRQIWENSMSRMTAYFVDMVQSFGTTGLNVHEMSSLAAEQFNIESALRWCADSPKHEDRVEIGLRLAIAYAFVWETLGRFVLGNELLTLLIDG